MKYNTHISLKAQPLQLEIEGTKASVEKLISHLTKFTEVGVFVDDLNLEF